MSDDVWLCWREDVTAATDLTTPLRDTRQVDRATEIAGRLSNWLRSMVVSVWPVGAW